MDLESQTLQHQWVMMQLSFPNAVQLMPATINLIVFDLGRVLIRICDGWEHARELVGVAGSTAALSQSAQAALHEIVCDAEVGRLDLDAFARAAGPWLGLELQAVVAISNAYLLGPYPGVEELLIDLNRARLMTACLSNTNANHWRMITDPSGPNFLPLHQLGHRFASHLLGMRKPEGRIYAHVERVTGVAPPRILFFDDLEENLAAARQRGWQTHLIHKNGNPITQARQALRERGVL